MKVWDSNGRLKVLINTVGDIELGSILDDRYLRKNANDNFEAGLTTGFLDGGNTLKFYLGKPYIKNTDDGLYYEITCQTVNGIVTFSPSDVGVAL